MNFTPEQLSILKALDEAIVTGEFRSQPPSLLIGDLCAAFDGNIFTTFYGIGGTRLVIAHPEKDGWVLKIAYNEDGVEGNRDEYNAYQAAPADIKAFLGTPGELLHDDVILEMAYYEPLRTEEELDDYSDQLNRILSKIDLIHYTDRPYPHSFGVDNEGTLTLIDYGETERFRIKNNSKGE